MMDVTIDSEARNLILRIMRLALLLNPSNTAQDAGTGNKPTVMVYFTGHVAGVDVVIYKNGYARDIRYDDPSVEMYTTLDISAENDMDALYRACDRLEEIYSEWSDKNE